LAASSVFVEHLWPVGSRWRAFLLKWQRLLKNNFTPPEVLLFEWTALMPRYYFDMREGDEIAPDEEGMELDTLEEVQEEAARTLADMAKDGIRGGRTNGARGPMSIEVRDAAGPVLQVKFTLEVRQLRH
jgi:hypothetical protein